MAGLNCGQSSRLAREHRHNESAVYQIDDSRLLRDYYLQRGERSKEEIYFDKDGSFRIVGSFDVQGLYELRGDIVCLTYPHTSQKSYFKVDGDTCIIDMRSASDYCSKFCKRPFFKDRSGNVYEGEFPPLRRNIVPDKTTELIASITDEKKLFAYYKKRSHCELQEFYFQTNGVYYTRSIHNFQEGSSKGDYQLRDDTLFLQDWYSAKTASFLVDGDSCIIDLQTRYDLCNSNCRRDTYVRDDGMEDQESHISLKRSIRYPQIASASMELERELVMLLNSCFEAIAQEELFLSANLSETEFRMKPYFEIREPIIEQLEMAGVSMKVFNANDLEAGWSLIEIEDLDFTESSFQLDAVIEYDRRLSVSIGFEKLKGEWQQKRMAFSQ